MNHPDAHCGLSAEASLREASSWLESFLLVAEMMHVINTQGFKLLAIFNPPSISPEVSSRKRVLQMFIAKSPENSKVPEKHLTSLDIAVPEKERENLRKIHDAAGVLREELLGDERETAFSLAKYESISARILPFSTYNTLQGMLLDMRTILQKTDLLEEEAERLIYGHAAHLTPPLDYEKVEHHLLLLRIRSNEVRNLVRAEIPDVFRNW